MDSVKTIDNFLPRGDFEALKDAVFHRDFPWHFSESVAYRGQIGEDFYFTHLFFIDDTISSSLYHLIQPVLDRVKCEKLIRVKANLYPNVGKPLQNGMHVDYEYEHKGALLSLNTNNGYTTFEDGKKYYSVENRIMLFDPTKLHASGHCTDVKRRVNINFNYF